MRQFFAMSQRGDLAEAASGLKNPQFIMLLSNADQFEEHVKSLEKLYPGVPSIGCIGMGYDTSVVESGVAIIAFTDGVSGAGGGQTLPAAGGRPAKGGRLGAGYGLHRLLFGERRLCADHNQYRAGSWRHFTGGRNRRRRQGFRQRQSVSGRGGLWSGAESGRPCKD